MSRRPPVEGDTLGGRYRLVRLIGEGGMGRVFLAQRDDLGGQVAIKILREDGRLAQSAIERFRREAQSASRLKSESVVRVLDMGVTDDGTPFIVMERVVGKTLARHLADEGPLGIARAVDIVIDVCAVLAEAHALGIVHRDIKTSNLALTKRPDGTELVKVLDFGIAKQTAADVSSLTETAAVLGSPKYMSPEQIRDARAVGPLDDLWSLAVLLQEITTGALPFEAFTVPGLFAKIVADPPTPARSVRPDLPAELEALLLRALAKEPAARFRDAADFAEALIPFASPEGARRAARVRPVFTHATSMASSAPPPAADAPLTRTDLDATNAPIAREHPAPAEPARPSAARRLPAIAAAAAVLAILLGGAAWRARPTATTPTTAGDTSPSTSALPPSTRMNTPPAPSSALPSLPPAVALPRPAASPSAVPSPGTSTRAFAAAPPAPSATPAPKSSPPKRAVSAGGAPSRPRGIPADEDFGPRQ